jgi:2-polyprenyl-6-methoxyphenol hydroxylase-like FAD-dependent oxidoreductase
VKYPNRVLVAGAGPAGLALALQAHDHGAEVRIIERRPSAFRPSRALIMHARTLEVLRPLGVTQELLARADTAPAANLHLGRRLVRVGLGDLRLPDTAFGHLTLIRQMDVEEVLGKALAERGIEIGRGTELVRVRAGPGSARAVLRAPGRLEDASFDFVAGCDGAGSIVRSDAGIGWPGRQYPVEIVLADVEVAGDLADGTAHVVAGRRGLLFLFPLGEQATWRLLATRPAGAGQPVPGQIGPPVPAAEVRSLLEQAGMPVQLTSLAWSARVGVQHRVADQFRRGRVFLAGDAAHAYSPATGQGMNAAIQDAANLGWKLAFAARDASSAMLLDSYERERRHAARQVRAMTHAAFWGEASTGVIPSLARGWLAPLAAPLLPALIGRRRLTAPGFRLMSQLGVSYRDSPLSVDLGTRAPGGRPRAGDRLPDQVVTVAGRTIALHELLARPGIHVLLDRDADRLDALPPDPLLGVHRIDSFAGQGFTAVRPDGYVGLRGPVAGTQQLLAWLAVVRPAGAIAA